MRSAWWVTVVALAGCKKAGDAPSAPSPPRDAAPSEEEGSRARPSYLEEPQPFSIYEDEYMNPVIARDADHLYWFTHNGLYRRPLGGPDAGKVALQGAKLEAGELDRLEHLAVHDGTLYADVGPALIAMTIGGKDRRTLVADGVIDVAADATGVYVATREGLWQYGLDGGGPTEIAKVPRTIEGLALHDGHLYWSQWASATIHRLAITGGEPEELAELATDAFEIAVDGKGLVYGAGGALVERPPSGPSRVRRANDSMTGFVLDESWIYFADYGGVAAIPRDDRDPELVTSDSEGIHELWFEAGRLVWTDLKGDYAQTYVGVSIAPDHPEDEAYIVSPDAYASEVVVTGGSAYYRTDDAVWRVPVAGGTPAKFLALDPDADTPRFASADGVVYWSDGGTIRARSANGRDDEVTSRTDDANPGLMVAFDCRLAILDWGEDAELILVEPGASPRALWRPENEDDAFGDLALPLGDALAFTGPGDSVLLVGLGASADVREVRPAAEDCGVTNLARGTGVLFVLCTSEAVGRDRLDRIDLATGAIVTMLEGKEVAGAMAADDHWIYLVIGQLIARLPHDAKPRWQAD